MEQKFLISNGMLQTASWSQSFELLISSFFLLNDPVIAWALGMASLGAISLGSFQTGAVLLAGLFCYDVFWVFGTDVMMTVATKGTVALL
jgi:presenilin-like A22 family membrane protease